MIDPTLPIDGVTGLPDTVRDLFRAFNVATAAKAADIVACWRVGQLPLPRQVTTLEFDATFEVFRYLARAEVEHQGPIAPIPPSGVLPPEDVGRRLASQIENDIRTRDRDDGKGPTRE